MWLFISGIAFAALAVPLYEGLVNIFNQFVEYICTVVAAKTVKKQKEILPQEDESAGYSNTQAIGFRLDDDDCYYEDEDDE